MKIIECYRDGKIYRIGEHVIEIEWIDDTYEDIIAEIERLADKKGMWFSSVTHRTIGEDYDKAIITTAFVF